MPHNEIGKSNLLFLMSNLGRKNSSININIIDPREIPSFYLCNYYPSFSHNNPMPSPHNQNTVWVSAWATAPPILNLCDLKQTLVAPDFRLTLENSSKELTWSLLPEEISATVTKYHKCTDILPKLNWVKITMEISWTFCFAWIEKPVGVHNSEIKCLLY